MRQESQLSFPVLVVLLLMSFLTAAPLGAPGARAQSPPATLPSGPMLPPVSIRLVGVPDQLPPGGSGIIVVQLVDASGNPSPARNGSVEVSVYSSDPAVVSVESRTTTIPFGRSHAEVQMKAGIRGVAVVTAVASGFLSGALRVSSSEFSDFALQLVPLSSLASPGDFVELRVGLVAAGEPFVTPALVQVSLTTSLPGTAQQTVQIQPGISFAYASITVPSTTNVGSTPSMMVVAAADGFTSATSFVTLSQQGPNPREVLVGPQRANLTAGSRQFLSVSLYNGSFAPSPGSFTLDLFSSNSSVVRPLVSQVSTDGADGATFPVYANATGRAQITAVAPGLAPIPLTVTVVETSVPSLQVSLPPEVRVGEPYSFSVGFLYGGEPIAFGPTTVYLSSSDLDITVPTSVEVSGLGYGVATITAEGAGSANVTAVLEGVAAAATATVTSVIAPTVAPVTYTVTALSYSSPIAGVPVNFTYEGSSVTVATGPSGTASLSAYNDTEVLAAVPPSVTLDNRTFYFTGWSNGVKSENVSLLASTPSYSVTARYFRSVVPTTYSLLALSDGKQPVAGLRFSVASEALGRNITFATDSRGEAQFTLPNATSFTVSVPRLFQPSGQTRYAFLDMGNLTTTTASTENTVNVTSPVAMTVVAAYATYYQFQVTSPVGNTTGSGWYRSGSSASYSIGQTSSGGPLVFQRFAGWTGSFSSNQPSGSVIITSPEFITAQWSQDNSLLFAAVGGVLAAAAVIGLFVFRLRKKAPPS